MKEKTQHTQGPWTIEDGIRGTTAIIGADPEGGTAVLARLPHWPIEKEMQASNASLIAAAPDLAEALRAVVSAFECLMETNGAKLYQDESRTFTNAAWLHGNGNGKAIAAARAAMEKAGAA